MKSLTNHVERKEMNPKKKSTLTKQTNKRSTKKKTLKNNITKKEKNVK